MNSLALCRAAAMDEATLLSIQAECFAEDVPLPEGASGWSEDEVRAYFESGGRDLPARRAPLPARSGGRAAAIAIGGVELAVLMPRAPELVPWVPNAVADSMASSQDALATARWLMIQLRLGQDMLLLSEPGGRMRLLVFWLCSILGLEAEYVGVTRDTSEADLKQRRELRAGSLLYSDAPPLRAATNGRALILEGIEKAERNVLPLLNNLLENREMSLEDGTFLAGPSQSESDGESHESAGADSGRGARVRHAKRGFVVIGIGLPQPTYAGNPLDPPLRSRFATRRVRNATGSDAVYSLSARVPAMPAERLRQLCSTVDALRLRSVLAHAGVNAGDGRRLPYFPEGGSEAVAKLLTALPQLSSLEALERRLPLSVLRISGRSVDGIRNEISSLLASSALPMRYALAEISCSMEGLASPTEALASTADRGRGSSGGQQRSRACMSPYVCVCRFVPVDSDGVARGTGHVHLAAPCGLQPIWSPASVKTGSVTGADGTPYSQGGPSPSDIGAMSVNQLKALLASRDVSYEDVLEKSELRRLALGIFSADEEERTLDWRRWQGDGPSLVNSQLHALHSMCQEHAINNDTCVVAPRGVGKTTLVRRFAGLFGYDQPHTVFCHNEMPAHELLQRRATDPNGDTIWRDSPLLTAAKTGGLAVLDGIHRLPRGVLSGCLAPLFTDRMIPTLPDGSRLVPPGQWDHLLSTTMLSPMELNIRGIWCVHPSFRILATAEPATEIAGAKGWLDDELLPLFAWVTLAAPSESELRQMLRLSSCPPPALPILKVLLQYRIALEAAAAAEPSLRGAIPSQRQLLRVAAFVRRRPEDAAGALRRCTSAGMLTIPPASRETSHALLAQSARELGLPPSVVPSLVGLEDGGDNESAAPGWDQTPSKDSAVAARRSQAAHEMKELEGLAIQRRMMGNFAGIGAAIDRKLDEGVRKMQEERRATENAKTRRVCERAAAMATRTKEGTKDGDGRNGDNDHIRMTDKELSIGDVTVARRTPAEPSLVPRPAFVPIAGHVALLREMLLEWEAGSHLLLLGDQGVGKNKLTDKLLQLLDGEREYVQLHRDTTVGSLTLAPSLDGGIVSWRDSPLVRAARLGRVLVVDEADKAPLEVVCVLKALAEDGDLSLGDGRRLVSGCLVASRRAAVAGFQSEVREIDGNEQERLTQSAQLGDDVIEVSPAFRMIVLANPPGWPFQGNDFYRECGDVFSTLAVPNPGAASQAQLLRRVAPSLHQQDLATLLSLFARLRLLHAQGVLSYPYSVRELVLVSRRLDAFPSDGLSGALGDIFDADAEDRRTAEILANVLAEHGVQSLALELRRGKRKGDLSLQLEERSQDFGSQAEKKPPPMPDGGPKHGEWDGKPHVGGNKYAGGTGGTGTAGLGGRAGPYRLDVGQKVHMLSEEEKKEGLSQETIESAKRMADEAYAERLKEIGMSAHDAELYDAYATSVASQVARMRRVLQDHRERSKERIWLKGRPHGELDETKIVDGVAGASSIYKHRGPRPASLFGGGKRVALRFVMDLSGSMYTFERLDGRKTRLLEVALFAMQALEGLESTYEWSMVGHSGSGPEAEHLVNWGEYPQGETARLSLLKRMEVHTQFCHSGDKTFEATRRAIESVAKREADERFVFVISDADLARYGLDPTEWSSILTSDPSVGAYALLIASNEDEATRVHAKLAPGRGHICTDTAQLAGTFEKIFRASLRGDEL